MEKEEYELMYRLEKTHWWFRGKQFLVKNLLGPLVRKQTKQGRILDIGCGTGIILKILQDLGSAYGMEISFRAIELLKKRNISRVVCGDANQKLPFRDDTFSTITCLDVLEHLDNDLNFIKEIGRICETGGLLLVTVPAFNIFWSPHDVALHHKRRYTHRKMLQIISGSNFEVIKVSYYNSILSIPILVVRKFKSIFLEKNEMKSDLDMVFPSIINAFFKFLFCMEIWCLKFFYLPFGVSLVLILQKIKRDSSDIRGK